MRAKDLRVGDVYAHGNKIVTAIEKVKLPQHKKPKLFIHHKYRAEGGVTGGSIWYKQVLCDIVDPNKEMGTAQLRHFTGRGSKPVPYYVDENAQTQKLTDEIKKLLK
jgi:hypothetical protein